MKMFPHLFKFYTIVLILFFTIKLFPNPKADSTTSVRLAVVGDLMCHSPQYEFARVSTSRDTFNFNPTFEKIKKYLSNADFTFGNLETVVDDGKTPLSGYPRFNTPPEFISAIRNAGFDMLVTANNHAYDQGESGVINTIKELCKNHLGYAGTFSSQKDRDSVRVFNIKGITFSVLAYSFGTNIHPIPAGKKYLVNIIDYNLIKNDIDKARAKHAQIVIVYLHFGKQYLRVATANQKYVVEHIIRLGADIILGSHPHVLEPAEFYKTHDATLDTGFVIYSLGNFISNQRWRYSDGGAILYINLLKNNYTGSIKISKVEYVPTWVYKGPTNLGNQFMIINPCDLLKDTSLNFLSYDDIQEMLQSFSDTKETLHKNTSKILLYRPESSFYYEDIEFLNSEINKRSTLPESLSAFPDRPINLYSKP